MHVQNTPQNILEGGVEWGQNVLRPAPDVHEKLSSNFALTSYVPGIYDKGRASESTARADAQGFRFRLRLRERSFLRTATVNRI